MAESGKPNVAALVDSIPPKEYSQLKDWLVKQVVITKSGGHSSGLKMPGVHVKDSPATQGEAGRKLARMGTSKMHKFHPSVSIPQALQWMVEYGAADASLLFDNSCSAIFEAGKFAEFEDVRDEDEEGRGGGGGGGGGRAGKEEVAEEEDEDEEVKGEAVEGERFRLGSHDGD